MKSRRAMFLYIGAKKCQFRVPRDRLHKTTGTNPHPHGLGASPGPSPDGEGRRERVKSESIAGFDHFRRFRALAGRQPPIGALREAI